MRSFQLSQSSLSACCSRVSALARISTDCAARMLVIARALPSSLFRALRSPPERGVGWCFGAIRASRVRRRGAPALLERRPAAVLFVTAGPVLAGVIQEPLAHVFPDGLGSGQPDSIGLLNLDDASAPAARHPQNMLRNFREPLRPDRGT